MSSHARENAREETERIIKKLRTALRLLGFTNREIERRLGYTPSYLTRLFSGQIELRFEHIVDIVTATGMTVEEFFHFAYPLREAPLSAPAQELDEMLEELRPSASPKRPQEMEEKLERLIRESMEEATAHFRAELERPKPRKKASGMPVPRGAKSFAGSDRTQSA